MRAVHLLALATALFWCEAATMAAPTDQEQLVGVWNLVTADTEVGHASGEQLNKIKLAFTGRTYLVSTDQPVSGTYVVETTGRVKLLDMKPVDGPNKGTSTRCIYELDGDTLRICQAHPGAERPTAFPTKPTPGIVVLVFKRLTP